MEKENQIIYAEYHNEKHKRTAVVTKDKYHYVVKCYEKSQLKYTRLLENKSIRYAEDLAENYVEGYGEFKIASLCN